MSDERAATDIGGGRDGATDRVDYPKLFAVNLGLAVTASGNSIVELGDSLDGNSPARRRAKLFGILEELDRVVSAIEDAKALIREQAQNISYELSRKDQP